jgi:hypothetical protein
MSEISRASPGAEHPGADGLLARLRVEDGRARAAETVALSDFAIDPNDRLDDRTRAGALALASAAITCVAAEVREHALRQLKAAGDHASADALARTADWPVERYLDAVTTNSALMREWLARVRMDAMAREAEGDPAATRSGLLTGLRGSSDRVVAAAAGAVLAGESRRRAAIELGEVIGPDLPTAEHELLVWTLAATMRTALSSDAPAVDQALIDAGQRSIAASAASDRLEAAAARLVTAIAPAEDEMPTLIDEAVADRRPMLVVALLAHALGTPAEQVRDVLLDARGERLWLCMRALNIPRRVLARVALMLAAGDPRRDLEQMADTIDQVEQIARDGAREAVTSLTWPTGYADALREAGVR